MPPPIPSGIHPESLAPWLIMILFGAYHGLNPGMGWLFALSIGLQQASERAIWKSLFPIAAGHAASVAVVALLVLGGARILPLEKLQIATALLLLSFGLYKIFRYYRHPRWVGMKVGMRDLFTWSFLMATAHGAGLMVAPAMVEVAGGHHAHHHNASLGPPLNQGLGLLLAVSLHTLAMLAVMGGVAWLVYRKWGVAFLRRTWINFDLLWAIALLVVGGIALAMALH
jgi:hypothetical protein